ncbi:MAG: ABC transporter ATP-binding protein [Lachnospiraceae bacterium]|nr:ABC transporter ATP-binding protein [Lachnospiraceae bacterium]
MKDKVLKAEHLSKRFGGVKAVKDFCFELEAGQIVAVIGPNGAGKTTIFNLLSKIYQPDTGTILFGGEDITGKPQIEVARMGISRTFQNTRLFSGLNVLDNVKAALDFSGKCSMLETMLLLPRHRQHEKETTRKAMECLSLLNLADYAGNRPGSLPYGIQRRVEIARALVAMPRVLMLDEPAAGLNPEEVFQLMDFIGEIREKYPELAIMVIEHRMDLIMNLSDYIYVQDFGQTIAEGVPEVIQNNPLVLKAYLGEEV